MSDFKEMPVAAQVPYKETFDWPTDVPREIVTADTHGERSAHPLYVSAHTVQTPAVATTIDTTDTTITFQEAYDMSVREMLAIRASKRNDYVGDSSDDLRNYRTTGQFLGTSTYHVMLARLFEKLQRCKVLIIEDTMRAVNDEAVADTLLDIANIALLVKAGLDSGDDGQ